MINEEQQKLVRWHHQPRRNLFLPTEALDGCPVPLHRIYEHRLTIGNLVTTGERFSKTDDWLVKEKPEPERVVWTGRTEFEIKPTRESMGEIRIPASSSKRPRLEVQSDHGWRNHPLRRRRTTSLRRTRSLSRTSSLRMRRQLRSYPGEKFDTEMIKNLTEVEKEMLAMRERARE